MSEAYTAKELEPLLVPGPVYGFRTWWVGDGYFLRSYFRNEIWLPRQAKVARCGGGGGWKDWRRRKRRLRPWETQHRAPEVQCNCGIYAMAEVSDVRLDCRRTFAVGKVALWGKIVEHELGWRAEFAYPVRVVLVGEHVPNDQLERMAELYGVPFSFLSVEDWDNLWRFLQLRPTLRQILEGEAHDGWRFCSRARGRASGIARAVAPDRARAAHAAAD